jgi:hypothetical protein
VCVRSTVNTLFRSKEFPGRASYPCSDLCCASRKVVTHDQRRVQIDGKSSKYVSPDSNRSHNARSLRVGFMSIDASKKSEVFPSLCRDVCASNNGKGVSR